MYFVQQQNTITQLLIVTAGAGQVTGVLTIISPLGDKAMMELVELVDMMVERRREALIDLGGKRTIQTIRVTRVSAQSSDSLVDKMSPHPMENFLETPPPFAFSTLPTEANRTVL